MTLINKDLVNFAAPYFPIDKIVNTGTKTIVNNGATTAAPQTSKIVTSTDPNPYLKKCFCRFVYSIDGGVSYNGEDAHLAYTYDYTFTPGPFTSTLGGLKAAVSVGVDAANVNFVTANGYHGNVTDDGVNITYTTNSLTFIIKYALYEVE